MSRHTLTLPIRTLSAAKSLNPQWVCRRCLATHVKPSEPPAQGYDPTLPASQRIGPDGNPYRLKKSDFYLKKYLPQGRIPDAYLSHSTSEILHPKEQAQREHLKAHRKIVGVVISAGKMDKTVKVRLATQTWNTRIGKYFGSHENHLVHDPNSSLVEGDVVELHKLRVSSTVRHVVAAIVSPFGKPISERPPIPTADERLAAYKAKRFAKLNRRELRVKAAGGDADAIAALKSLGLSPGDGAAPGVGRTDNVQSRVGKSRNSGKAAIVGEKGQKLSEGALPGGKHEVGKINDRSKHNKEKAMKYDAQAEDHFLEAKEKGEELEREGLGSNSALR